MGAIGVTCIKQESPDAIPGDSPRLLSHLGKLAESTVCGDRSTVERKCIKYCRFKDSTLGDVRYQISEGQPWANVVAYAILNGT
jgi:hypothetical protein